MALKIVHKLLVILRLKKKPYEKYDYDANMHLESQGFYSEGLEGVYQCPTKRCKNSVSVYRQVRRQNDEFHDVLRFEQPIPAHPSPKDKAFPKSDDIAYTSSGVASISVPVVWNGENRNPIGEKEYIGELKTTEGKTYTLVKQRYFTSVMCVKCKKDMHLWDELRKYDGEDELRWFLARKEGNSSKKDVEDGGSSDAETLVGL